MQREFVIVYKARPDSSEHDLYIADQHKEFSQVTSVFNNALVYYNLDTAKYIANKQMFSIYNSLHEPATVMEKITTISLKPAD